MSGDDFVKALTKIGYRRDHTEGSHIILLHPSKGRLSVPRHKELGRGLLLPLIRDAGLSRDEFLDLI
ncbi:MAG: type II toxin-antitoxin system HicA family toxin [Dehalococcoidales bacterium]